MPGQSLSVLPYFNIHLVYNTGAAFSFLADSGSWPQVVFMGMGLSLSFWMASQLYQGQVNDSLTCAVLALALGGTLGNLCDRILFGKVTDFIDFHIGNWHFATFNVADSVLCLSMGLWCWAAWRRKPAS